MNNCIGLSDPFLNMSLKEVADDAARLLALHLDGEKRRVVCAETDRIDDESPGGGSAEAIAACDVCLQAADEFCYFVAGPPSNPSRAKLADELAERLGSYLANAQLPQIGKETGHITIQMDDEVIEVSVHWEPVAECVGDQAPPIPRTYGLAKYCRKHRFPCGAEGCAPCRYNLNKQCPACEGWHDGPYRACPECVEEITYKRGAHCIDCGQLFFEWWHEDGSIVVDDSGKPCDPQKPTSRCKQCCQRLGLLRPTDAAS